MGAGGEKTEPQHHNRAAAVASQDKREKEREREWRRTGEQANRRADEQPIQRTGGRTSSRARRSRSTCCPAWRSVPYARLPTTHPQTDPHTYASEFLALLHRVCVGPSPTSHVTSPTSHHALLGGLELSEPGCRVLFASGAEARACVLVLREPIEAVEQVLEVAVLKVRDKVATDTDTGPS